MSNYHNLIDEIKNLKRDKHSKWINLSLLSERVVEDFDNFDTVIDDLCEAGVLKKSLDAKKNKTCITVMDDDIDTKLRDFLSLEDDKEENENISKDEDDESLQLEQELRQTDFDADAATNVVEDEYAGLRADFEKFRKNATMDYDALLDFTKRLSIKMDTMIINERKVYQESFDRCKSEIDFLRSELKDKNLLISSLIHNSQPRANTNSKLEPIATCKQQQQVFRTQHSIQPQSLAEPIAPYKEQQQVFRSQHSIQPQLPAERRHATNMNRPSPVVVNHGEKSPTPINASSPTATPTATTPATNDTTAIVTDSHGARIKGRELSRHIDGVAYVTSIAGAKAEDMPTYVLPSLKKNARRVIIHAGCNDILQSNGDGAFDPKTVVEPLLRSVKVCKDAGVEKVFISTLLPMKDSMLNNYVNQVNRVLYEESLKNMFVLIRNDNISIKLLHDNIHFNNFGRDRLANNFINYINENFLY